MLWFQINSNQLCCLQSIPINFVAYNQSNQFLSKSIYLNHFYIYFEFNTSDACEFLNFTTFDGFCRLQFRISLLLLMHVIVITNFHPFCSIFNLKFANFEFLNAYNNTSTCNDTNIYNMVSFNKFSLYPTLLFHFTISPSSIR